MAFHVHTSKGDDDRQLAGMYKTLVLQRQRLGNIKLFMENDDGKPATIDNVESELVAAAKSVSELLQQFEVSKAMARSQKRLRIEYRCAAIRIQRIV